MSGGEWPRTHAHALPAGYVAQPVAAGERNGTKWELNRVYDPAGRLDRARTYWEVRQILADDPAPRFVEYAAVAPAGVTFSEFSRSTTPLALIECWTALARRKGGGVVDGERRRPMAFAPDGV
jgi:hypothetical protein